MRTESVRNDSGSLIAGGTRGVRHSLGRTATPIEAGVSVPGDAGSRLTLWCGIALSFGLFLLCEACPPVWASAWNRPAGQGLIILDGSSGGGGESFDGTGQLIRTRRYDQSELSGYVEYGVTDWLMVVARPSLVSTRLGQPGGSHYEGLGETDAGAQAQLLVFGPAALAVQGTFHLPGTTSHDNPAEIGNTAHEADLRMLGGVGFTIASIPAFIDLQGSFRLRSAGAASQWHGDATFGFSPTDRLLMLLQSFTSIPDGVGTPRLPSSRYTKIAATGVYRLTTAWSVQLSVFTTVDGQNALRERGVTTGLWYRF